MKLSKHYAAQIAVVAVYAIFLCLLWRTPLPMNMQNAMHLYIQTTENSASTRVNSCEKTRKMSATQEQNFFAGRADLRRELQKTAIPSGFALRNVIVGLAGAAAALAIQQTAPKPNCRVKHAE